MGKGDRKTAKGKRYNASYGNARPHQSVVKAGNSGIYNLKPVITGYFEEVSAIRGSVAAGAFVSAQVDGEVVKSTVADENGVFVLWPMVAGSYDVVARISGGGPSHHRL